MYRHDMSWLKNLTIIDIPIEIYLILLLGPKFSIPVDNTNKKKFIYEVISLIDSTLRYREYCKPKL